MPRRTPLFWIGTAGGAVLGGVLCVAAWAKMIDPAAFVELIELEGLDFVAPAWIVAPVGLALEAGLGLALLLNVRRLWVLLPAAGLCFFFLYLTGRAYVAYLAGEKDPASSCGCFGNLVERTPAEAFWGDLALLVPPLALAFLGRGQAGAFPRVRVELVAVVVLGALAFAWKAPDLPLDDLATRLRPGARLDALCIGEGESRTCLDQLVPEAAEGRHILLITETDNRAFRYAVPRLGDLSAAEGAVPLIALTDSEPDAISSFKWELAPTFPIRHAPPRLLRPMYRRTPRSALVEEGRVVRTFDGLPPAELFSGPGAGRDPDAGANPAPADKEDETR